MSNNEFGNLKGPHHPLHAFFVPTPAGLVLSNSDNTSPEVDTIATSDKPTISSTSVSKLKTAIASSRHTISSTLSFNTPIATKPPPLIINSPSFNDKTPMNKSHADGICWIAPLLGVLGTLGVVAVAIIYLIGRNKKKNAIYVHNESLNISRKYDHSPPPATPEAAKVLPNSYQSWASLSTINTSAANNEQEKKNSIIHQEQHILPPPAYTSIRQKRMTADTLVDDKHIAMMLKNQYSPQLAFSPSLVAGEFQQQQLEERPPLPTISPSNTLIDNAAILSDIKPLQQIKSEKYHYSFDQRPKKIEIYEPQVNLHDDDNPFIPYSYSTDEEEDSKTREHHIININSNQ